MSNAGKAHMQRVVDAGCVIGNRSLGQCEGRTEAHHVATGSAERSDFGTVGLCSEHHRGKSGLHGMGNRAFVRLYRVPGETEYGLLIWAAEDIAKRKL